MVIGPGNFVVVDRDHTAERPLIEIGLPVADGQVRRLLMVIEPRLGRVVAR